MFGMTYSDMRYSSRILEGTDKGHSSVMKLIIIHYNIMYIPEFSEAELMGQPSMVRLTGQIVMFILTNQNPIMVSK